MPRTLQLPSLDDLKAQAKALRASLAGDGQKMTHGRALEHIALQHGFRDWNTLHAAVGNRPTRLSLGGRVRGRYLGHAFTGEIIALARIGDGASHRLTVQFDTPVDVVAFEGMSALRSRVRAVIDAKGRTVEKTSDGVPHIVLDL